MGARRLSWVGPLLLTGAAACSPPPGTPTKIDETDRVVLKNNTHPRATAQYDMGSMGDTFSLNRLRLVLKRSPERQAALDAFLERLSDPTSSSYHAWLTPEKFTESYGVPMADIAMVTRWLESHGLRVDNVAGTSMCIGSWGTESLVAVKYQQDLSRS